MSDIAYSNDFWIAVSAFLGVAVTLRGLRRSMRTDNRAISSKEVSNNDKNDR